MIIRVNDQPLDFTIEKEKDLRAILSSLESWVGDNGGIIQKVVVDSVDIPLADEQGETHRDVSSVHEIDIYATSKERYAAGTLTTLGEYIRMIIQRELKPKPDVSYGEIIKGFEEIVEAANKASLVLGIRKGLLLTSKKRTLDDILRDITELRARYEKRYFEREGMEAIVSALEELLELIPKMLKWAVVKNSGTFDEVEKGRKIVYFRELLSDYNTVLGTKEAELEKIGRNLQIGNDREALEGIYGVTEVLDEYVVLLKIAEEYGISLENLRSDGKSSEELFGCLSSRLTEAHEALDLGDMVTVGDVMEYEIRPLYKRLSELLVSIETLIL